MHWPTWRPPAFLKHISVSIDGPAELHDLARGLKGTFERTCAGLRRLQEAARSKHAPLRVSINTTVAHESLDALDQMVDVAEELGVDAIGLNHLMFSTPEEVDETLRLIGSTDASVISTFVTPDPGLDVARVRAKVEALQAKCRQRNILFDFRPKVQPQLMENYYTPGAQASRDDASTRSCMHGCRFRERSISARSFGSKSATSPNRRSKRFGTATDTSKCAAGWSRMAFFPCADGAARSSCRRVRWPSPFRLRRAARSR